MSGVNFSRLGWGPIVADIQMGTISRTFRYKGTECVAVISSLADGGGLRTRCGPLGASAQFRDEAEFRRVGTAVVGSLYEAIFNAALGAYGGRDGE